MKCKEDLSLIENYDKAMADNTQTWDCHHRDEIKTLPSGITVVRTSKELKEMGRYYKCPANELIFLTEHEHNSLHGKFKNESRLQAIRESSKKRGCFYDWTGKKHTDETKDKIGLALKGKSKSEEHRKHLSDSLKGRRLSLNQKKKISQGMIGMKWFNNGQINKFCRICPDGFVPGRIK